ncbi:MAG: hypothetical protein DDT28_00173 [Dehalococcoidia bacterium]|nr:hypothetical protein [Chloroflexota bacterium]
MGLNLHHYGETISDVHHSGVLLAHLDEHALAPGGKKFKQGLGVLVSAVLTPERAEHPQLDDGRLPPQQLYDALVLPFGEGDIFQVLLADGHNTHPLFSRSATPDCRISSRKLSSSVSVTSWGVKPSA